MTLLALLGAWLSGSTFKLVHHVTASSTCDAFGVYGFRVLHLSEYIMRLPYASDTLR